MNKFCSFFKAFVTLSIDVLKEQFVVVEESIRACLYGACCLRARRLYQPISRERERWEANSRRCAVWEPSWCCARVMLSAAARGEREKRARGMQICECVHIWSLGIYPVHLMEWWIAVHDLARARAYIFINKHALYSSILLNASRRRWEKRCSFAIQSVSSWCSTLKSALCVCLFFARETQYRRMTLMNMYKMWAKRVKVKGSDFPPNEFP